MNMKICHGPRKAAVFYVKLVANWVKDGKDRVGNPVKKVRYTFIKFRFYFL